MSKNLTKGTLIPNGQTIARLRKEKGWSQDDFADECTLTKRTIQRIEKSEPAYAGTLQCIANSLGVPIMSIAESPPDQISPSALNMSISVGVLRSGDLSYTRDICYGFRSTLESEARKIGVKLEIIDVTGPIASPLDSPAHGEWDKKCRILHSRVGQARFDYTVTIGTQASIAMRAYLNAEFGKSPLLFLGVTDPVASGLVSCLDQRCDPLQIAGVAYGAGIGGIASRIHNLFPSRRLIFVYRQGLPQDDAAAQILSASFLYQQGKLRIVKTQSWPTLEDMSDPGAVYFSWYTFEAMFEDPVGLEILQQRLVVASTRGNAFGPRMAVAAVAADDIAIGRKGAELVLKHLTGETPNWGITKVEMPESLYWLNLDTAHDHSVLFPDEVINGAREIYGFGNETP